MNLNYEACVLQLPKPVCLEPVLRTREGRDLGVAFQAPPGSQASSRGEAKDSALLSSRDEGPETPCFSKRYGKGRRYLSVSSAKVPTHPGQEGCSLQRHLLCGCLC